MIAMAIVPDTLVTPAMLQGEKASMRARFVAHLIWKDDDHVRVDVMSPTDDGAPGFQKTREVAFASADSKSEKGRAVGLIISELLRESPAVALLAKPEALPQPRARPPAVFGGLLTAERTRSGNWALGPALMCAFAASDAVALQVVGSATFGLASQYLDVGMGVGVSWNFLRSAGNAHALGLTLNAGAFRESATLVATATHEGELDTASSSSSQWYASATLSLGGYLTLWRFVRLIGEAGLRASSNHLSLSATPDDSARVTEDYSSWRPILTLGLAVAL